MNDASKRLHLLKLLNVFGPFLGLALVLGLFSLSPVLREFMFTTQNVKLIFLQTTMVAIGALGMTMIIVSGGIDLSAGSVIALSSVVGALLIKSGYSPLVAGMAAILAGGSCGLINGSIIAGFRMVPFIVTLGMMGIARGVAKWVAKSQTVVPPTSTLNDLMNPLSPVFYFPTAAKLGVWITLTVLLLVGVLWIAAFIAKDSKPVKKFKTYLPKALIIASALLTLSMASLMKFPLGVWIAIAFAIVMIVVMRQTIFGRYVFAIGSNEDTARLCGIRVRTNKIIIYTLGGMFFGLAGLMQFSRLTLGDPTAGVAMELDIIAAVVIGGASLSGGVGSILGSMIGALIMAILRNGTNQLGWQTYTQEIIIGIVIILAVGIDKLRHRK
jgi:ribose/xylose/arabinose/galactoside ABC-type transport system permease subunit